MASWRSNIDKVQRGLKTHAETATKAGAGRIVDEAQRRSRVRTGTMRDGWTAERTGAYEYTVFNDVPWTVYNEYGTRYMSAQPMLGPAVELERHIDLMGNEMAKAVEDARLTGRR
jgi:HK97 gp10 family phage protein